MSRWFRFYADTLRNPKVMRLSDKDYRLWTRLLAVAAENDGHIPATDDLKLILGMRLDHVEGGLNRLISGGLIDAIADGYEPHNWAKFQYKSDTSNERVAKHRAKSNVTVTPPDTETDTERKNDDVVGAGEADFDLLNLAAECARSAGVRHIEPSHIINHGKLIREWVQAGADPPLILATIRDDRANPDAPTISSLKFFDAAIRKQIARKDATANGHAANHGNDRRMGRGDKPVATRRNPAMDMLRDAVRGPAGSTEADAGTPGGDCGPWLALPASGNG